jgi:nephrocystin-3
MGTGSSILRSQDEDDVLGIEYEGNSHGVIKRIPIEVKPRGKLGLRSVSSLGRKPKGGSLQSALSVDLENPEVERIKREFEMYRMQKENEIAIMEKRDLRLDTENKRMRSELQALQKTCTKLRAERDSALEAERQGLARAQTFEIERDKVQRQFKVGICVDLSCTDSVQCTIVLCLVLKILVSILEHLWAGVKLCILLWTAICGSQFFFSNYMYFTHNKENQ